MQVKVKTLSRKFIKPSTPTPNHLRTHKLSFFDHLQAPVHIPLVFFYPIGGTKNVSENAQRSQQFEKSLSETLTRFYPLAGRLGEDDLSIDCNDKGVEYLEAQVNIPLTEFLGQEPKSINLLCDLLPMEVWPTMSATTPMVAVQVNMFECGGLALAMQVSHIIGDGYTQSTFIHEWARASRLGIDEVICPIFDLGSQFPGREIQWTRHPPPPGYPNGKIVTKSFRIDEATLSNLRDKLSETVAFSGIKFSRVEIVAALIWKAHINVCRAKHGKLRSSVMPLPMNLRGRTAVSAPENPFGNFLFPVLMKFLVAKVEEGMVELCDMVGLIRDMIRNMRANLVEIENGDDAHSLLVDYLSNIPEDKDLVDCCRFTSYCRFPLYEVDFGWGKPYWVSAVAVKAEQIALVDTKCGTGIEAQVNLEDGDMIHFEGDPDIMALTSTS